MTSADFNLTAGCSGRGFLVTRTGFEATTEIERVITGRGMDIAVSATVRRPDSSLRCSGFYTCQAGLIERIEEAWIVPGSGTFDLSAVGPREGPPQ